MVPEVRTLRKANSTSALFDVPAYNNPRETELFHALILSIS